MQVLSRAFLLVVTMVMLAGMPLDSRAQDESRRNELGVAFNHVSVLAPGQAFGPETDFWQKLGGARREIGVAGFLLFAFPDMTVTVRDAEGAGGTVGSVVDHIGFHVPNTAEAIARFQSIGLKAEPGGVPVQGWVTSPAGVRVEILQDPELAMPIRGHHVHFFFTAPLEAQAWYARNFGAAPGKRGNFDAANITAGTTLMNLTFSAAETARAPTKGRALARVGFLITGMDAFLKRMQEQGVVIDRPKQLQADGQTGIAYILDPWGTWVELIDRSAGSGAR